LTQTFGEERRSLGLPVASSRATGVVEEAFVGQEPGVWCQGTDAAAVAGQMLLVGAAARAELAGELPGAVVVPKRFAAASAQVLGAVLGEVVVALLEVLDTAAVVVGLAVALGHIAEVGQAHVVVEALLVVKLLALVAVALVPAVGPLGAVPKQKAWPLV